MIFRLQGVSVKFEKNVLSNRNLKYAISSLFAKGSRQKIEFYALQDISLKIEDGEHVGLVGRNGAGKSTLLRILARVIHPQKGGVHVRANTHIVPLLELGIGFHPDLSGRENCFLSGTLMGYSQKEIAEKINNIISFSELEEFIDEPVKNYSSGMYARLAFALATDIQPEVLLIDEVFGVGDEFFMRKCIVKMQRLMRKGTTTVFVSHNLDFLVAQCDRLVWLDRGKIIMDGAPDHVASAYRRSNGLAL